MTTTHIIIIAISSLVALFILLDFIFGKGIRANLIVRQLISLFAKVKLDDSNLIEMKHVMYETIVSEFYDGPLTNLSIKYYSHFIDMVVARADEGGERNFAKFLQYAWQFISADGDCVMKNAPLLVSILDAYTKLV